MKKSDLTGAVSSVGVKDIKDSPVANIGQAMQGKVSGVQIIDAGKPGDNVTIKIRGLGTINNSNPLIVIDGIPTDLGLSSLNMADVERIDVLKDASATAIYGSRGANGVVMITSKRGAEGAGKVTVNANWAIQNATKVPDMLNAAQYAALSNDMLSNNDDNTNPYWADPSLLGTGTNWLDEMLRTGVKQSYSVSYSGGTEKAHYYVSGGFLDQSGIVESVNYRRFNFQANSDAQVNKWLKFTTNLTFSTDVKEGGTYSIGDAMKALPTQPVKNEDGSWSGPGQEAQWYGSVRNPIGTLYMMTNETKGYNFLANITGEIAFTKWLKLKSTFGYDAKFWFVDNFTPAYDWKPNPVEESSRYKSDNKSFTYLWDNYFVFDHTFAQKHRVGVMAGSSAQWNNYDYLNAQKNIFMFDNIHEMDNGEKMYSIGGSQSDWALLSLMARLNYSYEDKYLLTATVRRDGSSRFGPNNHYAVFPSFSLGWNLTNEKFMNKRPNWLTTTKIRLSWGKNGNENIGNFKYTVLTSPGNNAIFGSSENVINGVKASGLANPDLKWEESEQLDFGLDFGFFNNALTFTADYYKKKTNGMLMEMNIPFYVGEAKPIGNVGKMENSGIELEAAYKFRVSDWNFRVSANASYLKNKLIEYGNESGWENLDSFQGTGDISRAENGKPFPFFYGYKTAGIFQNTDEVKAYKNDKGRITATDSRTGRCPLRRCRRQRNH